MKKLVSKQSLLFVLIVFIALATFVPYAAAEVEAQCTTGSSGFSDVPNSSVFCTNVRRLAQLNITYGCGNGMFCPNDYVTRGQMAAFMDRLSQAHTTEDIPYLFELDHAFVGSPYGDRVALSARAHSGIAGVFSSYGSETAHDGLVGTTNSTSSILAGVYAVNGGPGDGLEANSSYGKGVEARGGTHGVQAYSSSSDYGHFGGWFSGPNGIWAQTGNASADGVYANCESGGACWGVRSRADSYGVYAATNDASNNYGLYTPDNIYVGGNCNGCVITYIVQNGGDTELTRGDLVSIHGIAPSIDDSSSPTMLVTHTNSNNANAVIGVVQDTLEIEMVTKADVTFAEVEVPDPRVEGTVTEWQEMVTEFQAPIHHLVDRAAQNGDYVVIVVQGLAQVKVNEANGRIAVGSLLGAGDSGKGVLLQISGTQNALGITLEVPDASGLAWTMVEIRR